MLLRGLRVVQKSKSRKDQSAESAAIAEGANDPGPALESGDYDFVLYYMPGHLIRRLQQVAVSLFIDEALNAGSDITPVQYAALMAIKTYPRIDQASLAGVIAYDRTTIGGVIDRLESKGLVRRTLSPSDRRVRQLVIEPAGERLLKELAPAVRRAQDRILAPLTEKQRKDTMTLLTKLVAENNERSRAPLRPAGVKTRKAPRSV